MPTSAGSRHDHGWLGKFLEHRIADKKVLRLTKMAGRRRARRREADGVRQGTPQGAWFRRCSQRVPALRLRPVGPTVANATRAATSSSFVMPTTWWWDSSSGRTPSGSWGDLWERFAKFGLELHPDKTRLIEFGRNAASNRAARAGVNRGRSTSSALRTSAGGRRAGNSCVKRRTISNGCGRS